MPIDYVCPYCHAKFYVDDVYRGQSGPCAECGKTITIPTKASLSFVTKSDATSERSKAQLEAIKQRARFAKLLRWGVLGFSVVIAVTISYLLAMIVIPEIEKLAIRRDASKSLSNLQRIAKALNEYAVQYGSYPPPAVTDAAGTPLYSWRVLILPQLGYANVYSEFHLDQPWSAPENMVASYHMPEVYRLAGTTQVGRDETSVSLATGIGTLFPPSGPLGPKNIKDDPSTTILVTEALRSVDTWTAPEDCAVAPNTQVGGSVGNDIGAGRTGIAIAVGAAENPLVIPESISASKLRGLFTPSGGEQIDIRDFNPDMMKHYINP
jgi:hypothetical protein